MGNKIVSANQRLKESARREDCVVEQRPPKLYLQELYVGLDRRSHGDYFDCSPNKRLYAVADESGRIYQTSAAQATDGSATCAVSVLFSSDTLPFVDLYLLVPVFIDTLAALICASLGDCEPVAHSNLNLRHKLWKHCEDFVKATEDWLLKGGSGGQPSIVAEIMAQAMLGSNPRFEQCNVWPKDVAEDLTEILQEFEVKKVSDLMPLVKPLSWRTAADMATHLVDDALSVQRITKARLISLTGERTRYRPMMLGWLVDNNPISEWRVMAVRSHLDCELTSAEATELAIDFLIEEGAGIDPDRPPDFIYS